MRSLTLSSCCAIPRSSLLPTPSREKAGDAKTRTSPAPDVPAIVETIADVLAIVETIAGSMAGAAQARLAPDLCDYTCADTLVRRSLRREVRDPTSGPFLATHSPKKYSDAGAATT